MNKLLHIIALACLCLITSAQASESEISDEAKPIIVEKQHPQFTISLKANPSTGYTWILKSANGDYIEPVFQKYLPAHTKLIGAPGVTQFGFVLKPIAFRVTRQFKITFIYARPWEVSNKADHQVATFLVISQGLTNSN